MMASNCHNCNAPLNADALFCSNCGTAVRSVEQKKEIEIQLPSAAQRPRKVMSKKAKRLYSLNALLILTGFGYLFVDHLPGKPNAVIEQQPSVAMATMYTGQDLHQFDVRSEVNNGYITIPLSIVLEKKIVAYEYQMETTIIPLLAFINSDGKLVTAIRFCEPCNSKTFSIEGLELACGNCETHWKQSNLEGVQGSCQKYPPAPIASTIEGGLIRIKESDVRNWKIRI